MPAEKQCEGYWYNLQTLTFYPQENSWRPQLVYKLAMRAVCPMNVR